MAKTRRFPAAFQRDESLFAIQEHSSYNKNKN